MRVISTAENTVPQDNPGATTVVYVESADAADLQAKAQAAIDSRPPGVFVIPFVDLAGGGDGHTFVLRIEFVNTVTGSALGVFTNVCNVFCYQASQSEAIQSARRALQPQLSERLGGGGGGDTLNIVQTLLAGSQKGTRFMGALITQFIGGA